MSFYVEFLTPKEEIFQQDDEECKEHAKFLMKHGHIYIDEDFPPCEETLGELRDIETNELLIENKDNPWFPPWKFSNFVTYRLNGLGSYQAWHDPHPFHVWQGQLGDCWLIAAIMCIATKRKLLEELVPRREYTMKCGLVQVRLFINERWQPITTDYHLPHINGYEWFAKMPKKQAWVAFIEKAYAKTKGKGTFGGLAGGNSHYAFTTLTGCQSRAIQVDLRTNAVTLWKDLNKWKELGFLIAAATPEQDKGSLEEKYYDDHKISDNHCYALLDFKVVDGHWLFHMGSNGMLKWNGKWSEKPGYDDEALSKMSVQDRKLSDGKTFWFEMDDFLSLFRFIYLGEFRDGWNETRIVQDIRRYATDDTQILRLNIRKPCKLVVEVVRRKGWHNHNLFLNIHRATADNQPGELIHTAHQYEFQISSGEFTLQPGTYFAVYASFGHYDEMENNWCIRSPSCLENCQIEFVNCPYSTVLQSVQEVFFKYGKAEKNGKVITYTWYSRQAGFVMLDNLWENDFVRFKGYITHNRLITKKLGCGPFLSWPVPPMSRQIVGFYSHEIYGEPELKIDIQYYKCFRFLNWYNWLDYWSFGSDLEKAVSLKN